MRERIAMAKQFQSCDNIIFVIFRLTLILLGWILPSTG
jgi:hypothetical protein